MHIAVYARASKDPEEKRISTDRQVARCGNLAADLFPGLPVVHYVDNDLSAADPDVTRPRFNALLEAIRRGEVSEIVTHEQSRLTRQPGQWDELVVTLTKAGIEKVHTVQNGPVPVAPGNRLIGRILAAVDAEEAERIKARTLAAASQLAIEGRPNGGRIYGYRRVRDTDDRPALVIEPEQASVVRHICSRLVAGYGAWAIASELNAAGTPTPQGGRQWRNGTIKSVVSKPSIAGVRAHNGKIVGQARWEAIIPMDRWEQVQRALGSVTIMTADGQIRSASRLHRLPRRWLLTSGIARCGRCGAPLAIGRQPRRDGNHMDAYQCHTMSGPNACRSISISPAELVEKIVSEAVLTALDSPKMAALLVSRPDPQRHGLLAQMHEAEGMLATAAEMYGSGEIDLDTFRAMHGPGKARVDAARACLAALPDDPDIDIPPSAQIRERWDSLPLRARRAIIERVVESVLIQPGIPGGARWFGAVERVSSRIQIKWRY